MEGNDNTPSCPICLYPFDDMEVEPWLGSCGHSLCLNCYNQMKSVADEKDKYKCALCNSPLAFRFPTRNYAAIALIKFIDKAQLEKAALNEFEREFQTFSLGGSNGSASSDNGAVYSNTAIFVQNIPLIWEAWHVKTYFEMFGAIKEISFGNKANAPEKNTGKVTIVYSTPQEADRAIKEMNRKLIGNIPITVTHYRKNQPKNAAKSTRSQALQQVAAHRKERTKRLNSQTVKVGSLPYVNEGMLRAVFGKDGPIQTVRILVDPQGRQTGNAKICFDSVESVERALKRNFTSFGIAGTKMTVDRVDLMRPPLPM